jgi:hypothetical protein
MPVILATQKAEIRRTEFQSQPRQRVYETPSQKTHQKRAGRVTQGVGPEFKPQYYKTNKQTQKPREVAQVVPCLPSKCETLNLNPSATKKKKKKRDSSIP